MENGPNLYAFVLNNPLKYRDLYGLFLGSERFFSDLGTAKSMNITVGQHILFPRRYILSVNGIGNEKGDGEKFARAISQSHGNYRVNHTYSSTHGFIPDVLGAAALLCRVEVRAQRLFRENILAVLDDLGGPDSDAHLQIYGHSNGNNIISRELPLWSPKVREIMDVYAFAPPKAIHPSLARSVVNYIDVKDPVALAQLEIAAFPGVVTCNPKLQKTLVQRYVKEYNIQFLPEGTGHPFLGGSYEAKLNDLGHRFLEKGYEDMR